MFARVLIAAAAIAVVGVGVAPAASADGPYRNCSAAKADGRYDIPRDDPDYWPGGDRDNDGIACES